MGVLVDQSSGMIFFTDERGGAIKRLDPSSNAVTTWFVGGNPFYLTEDASGNVFATVALAAATGGADAIVELTPSTGAFKAWAIPGGGLVGGSPVLAANGIAIDSAGNIWAAAEPGDQRVLQIHAALVNRASAADSQLRLRPYVFASLLHRGGRGP